MSGRDIEKQLDDVDLQYEEYMNAEIERQASADYEDHLLNDVGPSDELIVLLDDYSFACREVGYRHASGQSRAEEVDAEKARDKAKRALLLHLIQLELESAANEPD